MMNASDEEIKRKVIFSIIYTLVYFPFLLALIFWSTGVTIIGKSSFQSILVIISVAETVKYFAWNFFNRSADSNYGKKDDSTFVRLVRLFSWIRLKEGFKTILVTGIMIAVYFVISILFGAEVLAKHRESVMFGSLLSILTVLPVCLNLGCQSFFPLFLGVKPTNRIEILLAQNLYLTLSGAWFGAMTIPLDWDRPWQVWPIPCSLAAMIGFIASHLIMLYRMRDGPRNKKHKV